MPQLSFLSRVNLTNELALLCSLILKLTFAHTLVGDFLADLKHTRSGQILNQ